MMPILAAMATTIASAVTLTIGDSATAIGAMREKAILAMALQDIKLVKIVQKAATRRTMGIQEVIFAVSGLRTLAIHTGMPVFSAVRQGATTNIPMTSNAAPQGISWMDLLKSSRRSPFSSLKIYKSEMPPQRER